jgi:hypothetical protein
MQQQVSLNPEGVSPLNKEAGDYKIVIDCNKEVGDSNRKVTGSNKKVGGSNGEVTGSNKEVGDYN